MTCPVDDFRRAEFGSWLSRRLPHWQRDPLFAQRVRVRELRRAHPRLLALERECRQAQAADAASAVYGRLGAVHESLVRTAKAIAGLTAAGKLQKAAVYQQKRDELLAEEASLIAASPQRQTLARIQSELRTLRETIGLDQEEARVQQLARASGKRSTRSGSTFEDTAAEWARTHLMQGCDRILRQVTLGAVDTEFDQLLIKVDGDRALVLGAVEVKRNVNDLAHGFLLRRNNLLWLAGRRDRYDPQLHRTSYYKSGHFDRPYEHDGLVFDASSFHQPVKLVLLTRPGPVLGMNSAALSRLAYRVATDVEFLLEDEAYLSKLREWADRLAGAFETPELLDFFGDSVFFV